MVPSFFSQEWSQVLTSGGVLVSVRHRKQEVKDMVFRWLSSNVALGSSCVSGFLLYFLVPLVAPIGVFSLLCAASTHCQLQRAIYKGGPCSLDNKIIPISFSYSDFLRPHIYHLGICYAFFACIFVSNHRFVSCDR
jgi:hypothetical protein